jgi:hypothetical protein
MQQPSQESTAAMVFRMDSFEKQIKDLQAQLTDYVLKGENTLRLQIIQEAVARMERDLIEMKSKQAQQDEEARKRDEEARKRYEDQEKKTADIQIRSLVSIVSTIVLLAVGIITAYATHLIH